MSSEVSKEKIDELEKRIEALEMIVDEKLSGKIAQGLKDEEEGKVISLREYEESSC